MKLSSAECKALLTDPKVLDCLDEFQRRFYSLYANGMPMSGLAKLTLDDEVLAKKTLALIEQTVWKAAPKLTLPKAANKPESKPREPLRRRAGLTVRETARFLKDARVRDVVGEAEATFYEHYASSNCPMAELIAYVGTSNAVGVRVYAERIENTIIREALSHRLLKSVEPPEPDDDAEYERDRDGDHAKSDRSERMKHFTRAEERGDSLVDQWSKDQG
jgi:hypothetical protein